MSFALTISGSDEKNKVVWVTGFFGTFLWYKTDILQGQIINYDGKVKIWLDWLNWLNSTKKPYLTVLPSVKNSVKLCISVCYTMLQYYFLNCFKNKFKIRQMALVVYNFKELRTNFNRFPFFILKTIFYSIIKENGILISLKNIKIS